MKKLNMIILFACMVGLACTSVDAKTLSADAMKQIFGTCDCSGVEDDTTTCEAKDECKDCKSNCSGEPGLCPNDECIKNIYPGVTLKKCNISGTLNKVCQNDGTEENCYRPYRCDADDPVQNNMKCKDKTCDSEDATGCKCRACYTGDSEGSWVKKPNKKCS